MLQAQNSAWSTTYWAVLGVTALAIAACAPIRPPAPSIIDQWWDDLKDYEEQLQRFNADSQQLLEDFQELRANPNFPAVEEKVRDLAARIASGDKTDGNELIMSLGELLVFPRFLALSTRMVTLEATQSELERLRLDLRSRRITLERWFSQKREAIQKVGMPAADPSLLEQPVTTSLSCIRYLVDNLEFANCW